jgi:peptidoglycan/xylan/chitin deacetylase (PgdA/CDA1 family)
VPELLIFAHALRLSARRVGLAIVYHRVDRVPSDPTTHLVPALSSAVFRRQLALVKACFELVAASELASKVRRRRRGERIPLAVTFDDDLECHTRVTAPLLRQAGTTATFFLCGADLDLRHGYWWDHLQAVVDNNALSSVLDGPAVPSPVAGSWSGRPDGIHAVADAILRLTVDERDALTLLLASAADRSAASRQTLSTDGIRWLAAAGFEIGFHTLRHDRLPALDRDRLIDALTVGREQLEEAAGQPLLTIAYPHGAADQRVAAAARAAGYRAGFTTRATAIDCRQNELLLGRVECSYRSATELAWRIRQALRPSVASR